MTQNLKSTLQKGTDAAFSLSPDLMKSIEKETVKKTGSKLLTKAQAKNFLTAAGAVGGIFGAFDKWLEGDKKGAVLTLGCGVATTLIGAGMLGPALGVGAAAIIAAALLKKKKEAALLMQGGSKCNS